jgi:hypothetical protein
VLLLEKFGDRAESFPDRDENWHSQDYRHSEIARAAEYSIVENLKIDSWEIGEVGSGEWEGERNLLQIVGI